MERVIGTGLKREAEDCRAGCVGTVLYSARWESVFVYDACVRGLAKRVLDSCPLYTRRTCLRFPGPA